MVEIEVDNDSSVVLYEDDGLERTQCNWVSSCASGDCLECPAYGDVEIVSHKEAIAFWENI